MFFVFFTSLGFFSQYMFSHSTFSPPHALTSRNVSNMCVFVLFTATKIIIRTGAFDH
jgi:hypothetical protein